MLRVIRDDPGEPAWNMAADEALLRHRRGPALRLYGWTVPAVSIGYFQPVSVVPVGRPFVRRLTGGGLVDHAADVTYTIVLPPDHPLAVAGTGASYRLLHEAVARALRISGVPCTLSHGCAPVDSASCFQKPVRFDVIGPAGMKLAGAAQRRSRDGVLHQGSILAPDLPAAFPDALCREIATLFGGQAPPDTLSSEERATAADLATSRYGTDAWNRRR